MLAHNGEFLANADPQVPVRLDAAAWPAVLVRKLPSFAHDHHIFGDSIYDHALPAQALSCHVARVSVGAVTRVRHRLSA